MEHQLSGLVQMVNALLGISENSNPIEQIRKELTSKLQMCLKHQQANLCQKAKLFLNYFFSNNLSEISFELKIEKLIKNLFKSKNEKHRIAKLPKGTKDFHPQETFIRRKVIGKIAEFFKIFGA